MIMLTWISALSLAPVIFAFGGSAPPPPPPPSRSGAAPPSPGLGARVWNFIESEREKGLDLSQVTDRTHGAAYAAKDLTSWIPLIDPPIQLMPGYAKRPAEPPLLEQIDAVQRRDEAMRRRR